MSRFVQSMPPLSDVYASDVTLRGWLARALGPRGLAGAEPRLVALAGEVGAELRAAHRDAETDPPRLVRYDGWGARVDRVACAPGWERLRVAAAEHALVALPYLPEARAAWGARARVVQHALLHLYGPESATFTCPVAMADGAAALLSRADVDARVRQAWLPRLLSTDAATAVTSGQWMTEAQGGSYLGGTSTVAVPAADGWRISGEKWFCSAIDSAMAVVLARPAGAGAGSGVLSPFVVARYARDSPLAAARVVAGATAPGLRVHRLKDKLGTRAVPTAEVGLDGAYASAVGEPGPGGLARMMTLVVVTRLHNAAAAAGGMRRGLDYAVAFARARAVAGGPLVDSPLHRATLAQLAVDAQAAFVLAGYAFELLGRVEVDADARAGAWLRLVAPLAKVTTGKLAVASASEYLECFGGAGYVEDTGFPRLLRDAQVLPIWEGTTNVLALDVVRALGGGAGLGEALLARLDEAVDRSSGMWLAGATDGLRAARYRLTDMVAAASAAPGAVEVVARARELALTAGYALAGVLLVEHAEASGEESARVAAELWGRRWLVGDEVAADACGQFEVLCPAG